MLGGYIAEKRVGKTPCYKCEDREGGCHATCKRYLEWVVAVKKDKADNQKSAQTITEADVFRMSNVRKNKERFYKLKKRR